MSLQANLYQQFDPARSLDADEDELYVDWQRDLDTDDVKTRLTNSIVLSGDVPVCRLFTGHRGVGKTTELKRVKQALEQGAGSRKRFVSMLEAEQWMDLQDVRAPDVVLHIVRQLVEDLREAGFKKGSRRLGRFAAELRDLLGQEVQLKELKVNAGFADLGLILKDVPQARAKLRALLEGRLPTLYDMINNEILAPAKDWLVKPENGGFQGVVVIVDELDRIPQKIINDQGLTNHENLFLDHAGVLRFLACDVVYTVPIELAYSSCRPRLLTTYSAGILTLPVVPVAKRAGGDFTEGLAVLRRLVEARLAKAGAKLEGVFSPQTQLERLCRVSGGHVRNLFILLRSALERTDGLPLGEVAISRAIRRQAMDLALPLGRAEREALDAVHRTKHAYEDDPKLWYRLLRDLFVFSYEDEQGAWYDRNPILGELPGGESP